MAQVIVEIVVTKDQLKQNLDADQQAINNLVASLNQLGARIDAVARKTLDINTSGIEGKLSGLKTQIDTLVPDTTRSLDLDINTRDAFTKLQNVQAAINGLGNTDDTAPKVTINTASARGKLDTVKTKISDLANSNDDAPKITVNTASARGKLNFLIRKIKGLTTNAETEPRISVNTTEARDRLNELLALIRQVGVQEAIPAIELDTTRSRQKITHLINRIKVIADRANIPATVALNTETAMDSLSDLLSLLNRFQTELNKVNTLTLTTGSAEKELTDLLVTATRLREALDRALVLNLDTASALNKIRFIETRIENLGNSLADALRINVNTEPARQKINFLQAKIRDLATGTSTSPRISVDTDSARGKINYLLGRLDTLREKAAVESRLALDTESARGKITHLLNRVNTLRERLETTSTLGLNTESVRARLNDLQADLKALQAELSKVNTLDLDTDSARTKLNNILLRIKELREALDAALILNLDTTSALSKIRYVKGRIELLQKDAETGLTLTLDTKQSLDKITRLRARLKTLREDLETSLALSVATEKALADIQELQAGIRALRDQLQSVLTVNLDTGQATAQVRDLTTAVTSLRDILRRGALGTVQVNAGKSIQDVRRLSGEIDRLRNQLTRTIGDINLNIQPALNKLQDLKVGVTLVRADLDQNTPSMGLNIQPALTALQDLKTGLVLLRADIAQGGAGRVDIETRQARDNVRALDTAVSDLRGNIDRPLRGTAQFDTEQAQGSIREATAALNQLRENLRDGALGTVQLNIKPALDRIQDLRAALVFLRAAFAQNPVGSLQVDTTKALADIRDLKALADTLRAELTQPAGILRLDTGPALAAINDLKAALVLLRADIAQSGAGRILIDSDQALAGIREVSGAFTTLKGDLARNIQGTVQIETDRAQTEIREMRAALAQLKEDLRAGALGVVQIDINQALARIRDLKVGLVLLRADLQSTTGTVQIDISRALSSIRDLKTAMVLLRADLAQNTFGAVQIETERAQGKIRDLNIAVGLLRAELSTTFGSVRINTDVAMAAVRDLNIAVGLLRGELQGVAGTVAINTGPAEKELQELRTLVDTVKTEIGVGLSTQFRFDTSQARAEVRGFQRRLENLQSDLKRVEVQARKTAEEIFSVGRVQGTAAGAAAGQTPALAAANAGAAATSAATGVAALTAQFELQAQSAVNAAIAIRQYRGEVQKLILTLNALDKESKKTRVELEKPIKPGTEQADKGLKNYRRSQRDVTKGFAEMSRIGKRAFQDLQAEARLTQLGALTRTGGRPIDTGPIFNASRFQRNFTKAVKESNQVINEQRALMVGAGPTIRRVGSQFNRTARDVEGYSKAVQRANIFSKDFIVTSIRFGLAGTVAFQIISMIEALQRLPGVLQTAAAEFQNMQARIQLFNETQLGTAESLRFVQQTALNLGGDLASLRDSYAGLLPFVKNYQLTTNQAREIVEGFALAQKTAGVSNDRAREALFQLRQALGASSVEFEELRVILEAFPGLERLLADELGVVSGRLKDLTKTGELAGTTLADALPEALRKFSEGAENIQTLQQEVSRTKSEFQLLAETLGNQLSPLFETLNRGAQSLARTFRQGFTPDENFAVGFRNLRDEAEATIERLNNLEGGGFEALIRQIRSAVEDARIGIISLNEAQRFQRQIGEEAITLFEQRIRLARELKEVQAEQAGEAEDSPTSLIAQLKKRKQALRDLASEQKKLATATAADLQRQVQAEKRAADEILSIRLKLIEQERDIQEEIRDLQREPLRARADIEPEDRRRSLGAELEIITQLREAREQLANVQKAASKEEQVIAKDAAEAAIRRSRDLTKDIVDRNQQIFALKQVAQVQKSLLEIEKAGQEALREQAARLGDEAAAASIKAKRAAEGLEKEIKQIGGTKATAELELKENNIVKRIAEIDEKLAQFRKAQAEFTIEGRFIDNTPEATQRIVDLAKLIEQTKKEFITAGVIPTLSDDQRAGLTAAENQLETLTKQLIAIRKSNLLPETGLAQLDLMETRLNQLNSVLNNLIKGPEGLFGKDLTLGVGPLSDAEQAAVALQSRLDAIQQEFNELSQAAATGLAPDRYSEVRQILNSWQKELNSIQRQLSTGLSFDVAATDVAALDKQAVALFESLSTVKDELQLVKAVPGQNQSAAELAKTAEEAKKAEEALRKPLKLEVINTEQARQKVGEFNAEILNAGLSLEKLQKAATQGVDVKSKIDDAEKNFNSLKDQLDAILKRAADNSPLKINTASALADLDVLRERLLAIKRIAESIKIPSAPGGTATSSPGLNQGGYIPDDGGPNQDRVWAKLTPGEYVLPRESVRIIGLPALEAMRTLSASPQQIVNNVANNITNRSTTLRNQRITQITRAVAPAIAMQQFNTGGLVRQDPTASTRNNTTQDTTQPINLTLDLGNREIGPFPIRAERDVATRMIRELTVAARSR